MKTMKTIGAFVSVFAVTFLIVVGGIVFTRDVSAAERECIFGLPCDPQDIYCTHTLCWGTCYQTTPGKVFYCDGDWGNPLCSKDYHDGIPCFF